MGINSYIKRFSGTIAAALIFLILLGGIFLFNDNKDRSDKAEVFPLLGKEEVLSIMLKFPGSEVSLEKEGDNWFLMKNARKLDADSEAVRDLIEDISAMELRKIVPSGDTDLGEFGVQDPAAEFMLISDKNEYYILIGDKNPTGTGTYVYDVGKDRVLITDNGFIEGFLNREGQDFREKRVFDITPELVDRVVLRVGNFYIELHRQDGVWVGEPLPENLRVSRQKTDELVDMLSQMRTTDIVNDKPESLKTYGLDAPTAEIEIFHSGGSSKMLFGKRKDENEYYIKFGSGETVYSTSKENFKKLPKNIGDLAQK